MTHFLQIWIRPKFTGMRPGYEQKTIPSLQKQGTLRLVASPDGAQDSVSINADARMYAGLFDADQCSTHELDLDRKIYVHVVKGEIEVNGHSLGGGDAVLMANEAKLTLAKGKGAEVLVFDLAA